MSLKETEAMKQMINKKENKTASGKMGSILLQNYLVSLLSMVLCAAMFLGTSFAWFTSEVDNQGNEIYIGTLAVELEKKDDDGKYISLSDKRNGVNINTLFDGGIRWEPGYTAVETVRITNEGDLAFRYELTFTDGKVTSTTNTALAEVAKHFSVYIHEGDYAEGEEKPTSFNRIKESANWEPVMLGTEPATLADILEKGLSVLSGTMTDVRDQAAATDSTEPGPNDSKAVSDTYIIALHMNEGAAAEVMGSRLSLNVKLVAYQMSYEADSMGDSYDDIAVVTGVDAFRDALAAGKDIVLAEDLEVGGDLHMSAGQTIDGNGYTLKNTQLYMAEGAVVEDVVFDGVTAEEGSNLYAAGVSVTIKDCTFKNSNWDAIQATPVPGNEIVVDGCTFAAHKGDTIAARRALHVEVSNTEDADGDGIPDSADADNGIKLTLTDCHFDATQYTTGAESFVNDTTILGVHAENITASGNTYTKGAYEVNEDGLIGYFLRVPNGSGGYTYGDYDGSLFELFAVTEKQ